MTPEQYTSLHAQMMRLPTPQMPRLPMAGGSPSTREQLAYKVGHRDARHAAAELANAADAEIDRLRAEVAALRKLIADVDANMHRAWADRTLSADAWPVALAQRVANAATPPAQEQQK